MAHIAIAKDCPHCIEFRKSGGCRDNTCLDVTKPEIYKKIDKSVKFVPTQVCLNKKTGKYIKCGNDKIIRKYDKKKNQV